MKPQTFICRHGLFKSHFWDARSGLAVAVSDGDPVPRKCLTHKRLERAAENRRLIRQGVLALPCFHCDTPVALASLRDGKAPICPSCKTQEESGPHRRKVTQKYRAAKRAEAIAERNRVEVAAAVARIKRRKTRW